MMNAETLANILGRKAMADALTVTATAVSNAVKRGIFPASWFYTCKNMADAANVDCPPELFNMIGPHPKRGTKSEAVSQ